MANFTMSYFSPSLRFNTTIDVFVPNSSDKENVTYINKKNFNEKSKYPVLILLHDIYKDSTDLLNYTNILEKAQSKKMVVVMPTIGNNFYENWFMNTDYNSFILKELPQYVQRYFSVSKNLNDTYIGGVGMGGYGAVTLSVLNPNIFSYAFSLQSKIQSSQYFENSINKTQLQFKSTDLKIYFNCNHDDPYFLQYLDRKKENGFHHKKDYNVDCSLDISLNNVLNWIEEDKENCKNEVQCG